MANNYCTITELIETMPDTGLSEGDYDALLTMSIERASRMIDKEVGRWAGFFYPSTSDATRYYSGDDTAELRIDEMCAVPTSVSIDEVGDMATYTALGSTDYYVHPYNWQANGVPIKSICLDLTNGSYSYFDDAPKAVKVVGVFGYSATPPADIRFATIAQAVRFYKRGLQAFRDTGASAEQGQPPFADMLDIDIKRILAHYVQELQV